MKSPDRTQALTHLNRIELTSPRMILMTPERETRVSKQSKETPQPESLLYGHPTLVSSPSGSLDFLLCSPPRSPRSTT